MTSGGTNEEGESRDGGHSFSTAQTMAEDSVFKNTTEISIPGNLQGWHRGLNLRPSVEIKKVDANVEIKDAVQSSYSEVISQDGTLTVRFPANAFGFGINNNCLFKITYAPVAIVEKSGQKRIRNNVQAKYEDLVESRKEDGSYEFTFQGKDKEVGAYEFSFRLTYAVRCHINGVPTSMVVGPRTAVILLRVEVMCEEDTKRKIRVLESDQKVREVMEKDRKEKRELDCEKFDKELEEVLSDTGPAWEAACKSSGMGGGAK